MTSSQISRIRSFNRTVTRRVGALEDSYLSRGRPLGLARLIFEIGEDGAALSDLRARLGLDSGYLSRMLRQLEMQGLVEVAKLEADARGRRATLTHGGLAEYRAYEALSDDLAQSMLAALSEQARERLVTAMGEVERLMAAASISIEEEPADSDDAQQCLKRYFEELAARFEEGFDPGNGGTAGVDEYRAPKGSFVIARLDGEAVGCGAVRLLDDSTAEIKRMWVAHHARGFGVASRMLHRLEEVAARLGARSVLLDTNRALKEAQALYKREGYAEIASFNDNPYADHWFSKQL